MIESFYNMILLKHRENSKPKYKTLLYKKWHGIKARCYNVNNKYYNRYGGRGIFMSDEWKNDFEIFKNDVENTFFEHIKKYGRKNTSLERIDNDKGYTKENCKWATRKEQSNNTSVIHIISYKGENYPIQILCGKYNIKSSTLLRRIELGWEEDTWFNPINEHRKPLSYKSKTNTSGIIGICWDKSKNKWQVRVSKKFIGRYSDFDEAVYNKFINEIKILGKIVSEDNYADENIKSIIKKVKYSIL